MEWIYINGSTFECSNCGATIEATKELPCYCKNCEQDCETEECERIKNA